MMTTAYTLQYKYVRMYFFIKNTATASIQHKVRQCICHKTLYFTYKRSGSALGGLLYFTLKIFHNFLLLNYLY